MDLRPAGVRIGRGLGLCREVRDGTSGDRRSGRRVWRRQVGASPGLGECGGRHGHRKRQCERGDEAPATDGRGGRHVPREAEDRCGEARHGRICNVSAAIDLQDLRRDFGERPALAGVSFAVAEGETLAVLGPNGSGKTTLLRVLAGLLRPSGGHASVLGHEIPGESWRLRGRVGYLGHEALLYRDLTGRENLLFHARLHGLDPIRAQQRIESLLTVLGMKRRADDRIDVLSAGMRQRIAVCRCALHEPDLLLLDEPDSNLDTEGRELAREALSREGLTRVIVSHDRERALAEADRVLVLAAGGTVEHTGPAAGVTA